MPNRDRSEFEASASVTVQPDRTRPHVRKRRAKEAARAGIRHGHNQLLPLLRFVEAEERAALWVRLRTVLDGLRAVADRVRAVDAQLKRFASSGDTAGHHRDRPQWRRNEKGK
jgi:hypothetical protein